MKQIGNRWLGALLSRGCGCVCALFVAACGGGDGPGGANWAHGLTAKTALVRVIVEAPGVRCSSGGSNVSAGLDLNSNAVLDDSEITSTQYVCNGIDGIAAVASLVKTAPEPAGSHCANGGTKISAGRDTNGNSMLDAAEVLSVDYVCSGLSGSAGTTGATGATGATEAVGATGAAGLAGLNSLIVVAAESSGTNCPYGGSKITSGLDINANATLDAQEVTYSTFICNGSSGVGLVRIDLTSNFVQAQSNGAYLADSETQVVVNLPSAPAIGDTIQVSGGGTGGWKIAQNPGQSILTRALSSNTIAPGASWVSHGSLGPWVSIASSADGQKLAAVGFGDRIYTSTDAGLTWTARESYRNWWAITSSADGSKLMAVAGDDQIYTSNDSGVSWIARDSARYWRSIASSSDGSRLVAAEYGGQIYTSYDAGATWTPRDTIRDWTSVASSADGNHLVAVENFGQIYTSSDAGLSWTPRESTRSWRSVASSADFSLLAAVGIGTQIYISTDTGATWTARDSTRNWQSVALSADGHKLFASDYGGLLYTSADAGLTWTPRESSRFWAAVASSADGNWLVAVEYGADATGGFIHTSVGGRTTPGAGGSLSGRQYDAIELQFVGGGTFIPISSHSDSGAFLVQ